MGRNVDVSTKAVVSLRLCGVGVETIRVVRACTALRPEALALAAVRPLAALPVPRAGKAAAWLPFFAAVAGCLTGAAKLAVVSAPASSRDGRNCFTSPMYDANARPRSCRVRFGNQRWLRRTVLLRAGRYCGVVVPTPDLFRFALSRQRTYTSMSRCPPS